MSKLTLVLLAVVGASIFAQDEDTLPVGAVRERSLAALVSAGSFRPVGDYRTWRFFAKQTTFGLLTSLVKGTTDIDGQRGLILEENLSIDYALIGTENQVQIAGESYISNSGHYLGSKLILGSGGASERFEVARKGDVIEGFFTRSGTRQDISVPVGRDYYFWDANFVDQLEYFLAMQDLSVGTRLDDSIYLPQSLVMSPLVGQVIYFMWQEIYRGTIDSVFIIRLTQPSDYQLYFTPDRRLVRVDMINQGIRIYQDVVRVSSESSAQQLRPRISLRLLLFKLPHYAAFLVVAAVVLLLFSAPAFRRPKPYLFAGAGGLLYLAVPLLVNPTVASIVEDWLQPGVAAGGSLLWYGLLPPLVVGVSQAGLITAGVSALVSWFKPRPYRLVGLGAFLGAGFGLAEAVYVSGLRIGYLFDWPLAERATLILIHVISGALIGRAWTNGLAKLGGTLAVVVLVNAVARYLPLVVQAKLVDVEAMHFVLVAWSLAYLLVAMIMVKKVSSTRTDSGVAVQND